MRRLLPFLILLSPAAFAQPSGGEIYKAKCAGCHDAGLAQAPRPGVRADWEARVGKGRPALIRSALYGMPRGVKPPRSGDPALSDREITLAVDHLLSTLDLPINSYSPPARIGE